MVNHARTLLFVPGDRADRFAKAHAAGAGQVVLDLEDAVAPEQKAAARANVVAWLAVGHDCVVRLNAAGTEWHADDVVAVAGRRPPPVLVPKAEDPTALRDLAGSLGPAARLVPLIETARGVLGAASIAAVPGVCRLALGNLDLAARLGVAPDDRAALAGARGALVLASAAAGIAAPIDGVTSAVSDMDVLTDDVVYARRLGFTGKLCVHPRQVGPAEAAFRPTAAEVRWARSIVDAAGVTVVDGRMVDKPVVDRARSILSGADE